MIAYPLNNIDYTAEDAELFHCTRSSGVFLEDDFTAAITGADNQVTVGEGVAWIRNSRFSGKVLAQKEAVTLDLGLPDSALPRIDAVVIQFSANLNAASVVVKQGTAASSPVPPEVVQTEALYELHLYHVRRAAGAAVVTAGDVTDLRLDAKYCGLMADAAHKIDTSVIKAQVDSFIEQLQVRIAEVSDGRMYEDAANAGCFYRVCENGELEWINPPALRGRVYRTSERFLGKAVYLYHFRTTTDTAADLTDSIGDVERVVDSGCVTANGALLPYTNDSGVSYSLRVNGSEIVVSRDYDTTELPPPTEFADVWVKYIKV